MKYLLNSSGSQSPATFLGVGHFSYTDMHPPFEVEEADTVFYISTTLALRCYVFNLADRLLIDAVLDWVLESSITCDLFLP